MRPSNTDPCSACENPSCCGTCSHEFLLEEARKQLLQAQELRQQDRALLQAVYDYGQAQGWAWPVDFKPALLQAIGASDVE